MLLTFEQAVLRRLLNHLPLSVRSSLCLCDRVSINGRCLVMYCRDRSSRAALYQLRYSLAEASKLLGVNRLEMIVPGELLPLTMSVDFVLQCYTGAILVDRDHWAAPLLGQGYESLNIENS